MATDPSFSYRRQLGAVLLAAGAATRMGSPKQLLEWKGRTLIQRAVEAVAESGCDPVIVVTGAHAALVEKACREFNPVLYLRRNPAWATGMGSSIAAGVSGLLELDPALDGVLIFLADQPLVTGQHLLEMRLQWESAGVLYIAAAYSGQAGVPVIFSRALFPELLQLEGPQGARALFKRNPGMLFPLPEAALDVDTPEDWERLNTF